MKSFIPLESSTKDYIIVILVITLILSMIGFAVHVKSMPSNGSGAHSVAEFLALPKNPNDTILIREREWMNARKTKPSKGYRTFTDNNGISGVVAEGASELALKAQSSKGNRTVNFGGGISGVMAEGASALALKAQSSKAQVFLPEDDGIYGVVAKGPDEL